MTHAQRLLPTPRPVKALTLVTPHAVSQAVATAVATQLPQPLADGHAGAILTPSTATVVGVRAGIAAARPYYRQAGWQASSSSPGGSSILPPREFVPALPLPGLGRPLSELELANCINNVPTTAQQATLNGGIVIAGARASTSSPSSALAVSVAIDVGPRWALLLQQTPTLMWFQTACGAAGYRHLREDVVAALLVRVERWAQAMSARDRKSFLEEVEILGGAGEIGRQAALGSLDSTREFLKELQLRVPMYGLKGAAGAELIYEKDAMLGAVDFRDRELVERLTEVARRSKVEVKTEDILGAMATGARGAEPEARAAHDSAAAFGRPLTTQLLQVADKDADKIAT